MRISCQNKPKKIAETFFYMGNLFVASPAGQNFRPPPINNERSLIA